MKFIGFRFGEFGRDLIKGHFMNGYNFTERVRRVLALAREEAALLYHPYIGTEHLLLGLLREREGLAVTVMQDIGIDVDLLRQQLLEVLKPGDTPPTSGPDLPYTSRAKRVLELAMAEARELSHSYVGTEHLLLGLVREQKGIAAQVLHDNGCDIEEARATTLELLGAGIDDAPSKSQPPSKPKAHPTKDRLTGIVFDHLSSAPNHLSARTVAVVSKANLDAVNAKCRGVRVSHLLGALLDHGEGSAIAVLERLGVHVPTLRRDIEARDETPDEQGGPESRLDNTELMTVLGLAEIERERSDAPRVATHHLLLALMAHPSGATLLAEAGVTASQIRAEAARISG